MRFISPRRIIWMVVLALVVYFLVLAMRSAQM